MSSYQVDDPETTLNLFKVATIAFGMRRYEFAEDRRNSIVYYQMWKSLVPLYPLVKYHEGDQPVDWQKNESLITDVTSENIFAFLETIGQYTLDHILIEGE